ALGARGDVGGHLGHDRRGGGVRAVVQPGHRPAAVVVAHHARERHHRARARVLDQRGVLGDVQRFFSDRRAQDLGAHQWSSPRSCSIAWSRTPSRTARPSRTPPVEPGRLITSVRPATPASPRDNTAVGTFGATAARIASPTGTPSGATVGSGTWYPRSRSHSTISGPPRSG